jgi:hypothetical protein
MSEKVKKGRCTTYYGKSITVPDNVEQFPNRDVVRNEELCLVEDGQLLLAVEALNDDGDLGRVLVTDLLHVLDAKR